MRKRILSILNSDGRALLPLDEVRSIVKPNAESYVGMKAVAAAMIVGSEGRYRDFDRNFLPRHSKLRKRWQRVDEAYLKQISLPPIKLYELGGLYFVRDGNHRVSVALHNGVEFIDAEIIKLSSDVQLAPGSTKSDFKQAVIAYERRRFYEITRLDKLRPDADLVFSETGRYDDLPEHIGCHQYHLDLIEKTEVLLADTLVSWYDNIYKPIADAIKRGNLLMRFPGRTAADLYAWILRHWDELRSRHGQNYSVERVVQDFSAIHGKTSAKNLPAVSFNLLRSFILNVINRS